MSALLEALGDVPNACQILPTLLTGGQPSAAALAAFQAAGGSIVLDIRDPMEPRPIDEPRAVTSLGMEYVNLPVRAGTMDDATLERILGVLREAGDRAVLFHCASGNRVGGALIPLLRLDHAVDQEAAITEAMRAGLRSAEVLEWGLCYTKRRTETS